MVHGEQAQKPSFLYCMSGLLPEQELHEVSGDFQTLAVLMPQNADVFKTLFDISMKTAARPTPSARLKIRGDQTGDAAAQKQLGDFLYDQKDMAGPWPHTARRSGPIRRSTVFSNGTARLS